MNKLLLEKLKIALKSTRPLEAIKDIIADFEEVERLAKWREKIILSGKDIEKNKEELNKIEKILEIYNYPYDYSKDFIDKMLKKYFKQFK